MVDEKVIDKVKKLLALGNGNANKFEAEVAIAKAQEIMIKHNLSMELLEENFQKKEKKLKSEYVTVKSSRIKWWVKIITSIVAKNFRCSAVMVKGQDKKHRMGLVGLDEDVVIASSVLRFAIESCEKYTEEYILQYIKEYNNKVPFHLHIIRNECKGQEELFIKGFLNGVKNRLDEQIKENNWGLMLIKDELVETFEKSTKTKRCNTPSAKGDVVGGRKAYKKGYDKGKNFDKQNTKIEG